MKTSISVQLTFLNIMSQGRLWNVLRLLKYPNLKINKAQKKNSLFEGFSCLVEKISPNGEKEFFGHEFQFLLIQIFGTSFESLSKYKNITFCKDI